LDLTQLTSFIAKIVEENILTQNTVYYTRFATICTNEETGSNDLDFDLLL